MRWVWPAYYGILYAGTVSRITRLMVRFLSHHVMFGSCEHTYAGSELVVHLQPYTETVAVGMDAYRCFRPLLSVRQAGPLKSCQNHKSSGTNEAECEHVGSERHFTHAFLPVLLYSATVYEGCWP